MISTTLKALSDAAAQGRLVSIVRREPLQKVSGFPLAVGTALVLLREVNPDLLLPDGYWIVRVQDVVEVARSDWDRAIENVLRGESRLPDPADAPAVRLDGWPGALAELHVRGERLALECEDDQEEGYYLGAIVALEDHDVTLRQITIDGRWEDGYWLVGYGEITRVVLRSRYVEVFAHLAGELPGEEAADAEFRGEGA
jgi:hypothetical protein